MKIWKPLLKFLMREEKIYLQMDFNYIIFYFQSTRVVLKKRINIENETGLNMQSNLGSMIWKEVTS